MSSNYDPTAIDAAAAYPAPQGPVPTPVPTVGPEVGSTVRPGYGVMVVGVGWLVVAVVMVVIGGAVFMGILQAVA